MIGLCGILYSFAFVFLASSSSVAFHGKFSSNNNILPFFRPIVTSEQTINLQSCSMPRTSLTLRGGATAKAAALKEPKKTKSKAKDVPPPEKPIVAADQKPLKTTSSKPELKANSKSKAKVKKDDAYEHVVAPKHPLSAYFLFSNDMRQKIVQENPTMKMSDISKEISIRWKEASPDIKAPFEEAAKVAKKEYDEKKLEYESKVPEDVRKDRIKKKRSKAAAKGSAAYRGMGGMDWAFSTVLLADIISLVGKIKKDPNAPKKPQSAYMIFSNKIRESVKNEDSSLKFADIAKTIAERWHNLTKEEKEEYEDQAEGLKAKYKKEKADYTAMNGELKPKSSGKKSKSQSSAEADA